MAPTGTLGAFEHGWEERGYHADCTPAGPPSAVVEPQWTDTGWNRDERENTEDSSTHTDPAAQDTEVEQGDEDWYETYTE